MADGATVVGRKVGLTSRAMQEMLGVDQPDFGYLTDEMISSSGVALRVADYIAPRVEVEIAFRLGRQLAGSDLTVDDVLEATEAVAVAVEVIDSRIAEWRIRIADTIADNASSARVVLGAWADFRGQDLAALEAGLTVRSRDGEEQVSGRGDAVLGHPARAVAWLAEALDTYEGGGMEAGEIVIPGAMAKALTVAAGSTVSAHVEGLGEVNLSFSEPGGDR